MKLFNAKLAYAAAISLAVQAALADDLFEVRVTNVPQPATITGNSLPDLVENIWHSLHVKGATPPQATRHSGNVQRLSLQHGGERLRPSFPTSPYNFPRDLYSSSGVFVVVR